MVSRGHSEHRGQEPTSRPRSVFEPRLATWLLSSFGHHWASSVCLSVQWLRRYWPVSTGPFLSPPTGEAKSWGASQLVPTAATSELEHLQVYDTGLAAPQAPRTAGSAPGNSLGAHGTTRWRLSDRGVSATPDCPLRINIYISLFSHSTLELPKSQRPPPLSRGLGREVQWTQLGWGSQTVWPGGPEPFPVSQSSLSHWSPIFAPACLSLSRAGEGGGELCWE